MNFGLSTQARAIVTALGEIPALAAVGYLDDERQMEAAPAKMPAAWVALDKIERGERDDAMSVATWAVVLRLKRLAGLVRPPDETPALDLVEAVMDRLGGLRVATGATPLAFVRAEYMEPLVESATYLIRFETTIHTGRAPLPCPNP